MANILTNLLNNSYNCNTTLFPKLNLGPDTTLCPGDSILLNAKSSCATYLWQNGSTDSAFEVHTAGTYWVQVTNQCGINRDTIIISMQACSGLPVAQFASSDTTFCDESGKCINFFDFSTGNPTSWHWLFPGAVPDSSHFQNPDSICYYVPGTYPVTLIVTNSAGTDTLTVTPLITLANPPAPATITLSHDTLFSTHAAGYQWYYNGGPVAGATDSFYVYTSTGTYAVMISDGTGCNVLSSGFIITGLSSLSFGDGFGVRPNPATDELVVSHRLLINGEIEIYNALGEKIYSKATDGIQEIINCKPFAAGVYFIRLTYEKGSFTEKFVKE